MKATRPRHGRRPDLEARRLLGVEAQDAGLLLRATAAARPALERRRVDGVWGARRTPSRDGLGRHRRDVTAPSRSRRRRRDSKDAGTHVRAGRLRCCRAPPPGPRAGAGRCVGLGLSPAILQCERYFSLLLMLLARALLLATSYAIGASTGQLCVQRKAMSPEASKQCAHAPHDSRPGPRRLRGVLPPAPTPWLQPADPRRRGSQTWLQQRRGNTCSYCEPFYATPAHKNRRGNASHRSLQRAVETSRARGR